jgi:hypothetical protein
LHEKLVTRAGQRGSTQERGFAPPIAEEFPSFWRRLPRKWNPDYLDLWHAWSNRRNAVPDVWDYAIILRHTERSGAAGLYPDRGEESHNPRLVLLVLAGFTERGTAIAAHYLAKYWHQLWQNHVKGTPYYGDFVTLIEGPSDPDKFDHWREDPSFLVTPKLVHGCGIRDNDWYDRVENWPKEGQEEEHSH